LAKRREPRELIELIFACAKRTFAELVDNRALPSIQSVGD
jgi:hypothetical protein